MTPKTYINLLFPCLIFTLSACAQYPQPSGEVSQIHQEVSTLSQSLTKLSEQAVVLNRQNALNVKSTSGVYLLPGANTPAKINSQIGTLTMSLSGLAANGANCQAALHIQTQSALPAFTAAVESGELQGTTNHYQEINVQTKMISLPATANAADFTRQIGVPATATDKQVFIRIHDIQPLIDDSATLPVE